MPSWAAATPEAERPVLTLTVDEPSARSWDSRGLAQCYHRTVVAFLEVRAGEHVVHVGVRLRWFGCGSPLPGRAPGILVVFVTECGLHDH
jgi:hypothetical protein